jgi:hypothetical protein
LSDRAGKISLKRGNLSIHNGQRQHLHLTAPSGGLTVGSLFAGARRLKKIEKAEG